MDIYPWSANGKDTLWIKLLQLRIYIPILSKIQRIWQYLRCVRRWKNFILLSLKTAWKYVGCDNNRLESLTQNMSLSKVLMVLMAVVIALVEKVLWRKKINVHDQRLMNNTAHVHTRATSMVCVANVFTTIVNEGKFQLVTLQVMRKRLSIEVLSFLSKDALRRGWRKKFFAFSLQELMIEEKTCFP